MPNRPLVTIPDPTESPASLRTSVLALKELAEVLGGQRGTSGMRAVTWNDLIRLGLATDTEQPVRPAGGVPAGGFTSFTYTYDAGLTPPPAQGQARLDNAVPADATTLYLSSVNSEGINNANFFRIVTIDRILVQETADASRYVVYSAPGSQTVFDASAFIEIPIVWTSNGPSPLRTGQPIVVAVT